MTLAEVKASLHVDLCQGIHSSPVSAALRMGLLPTRGSSKGLPAHLRVEKSVYKDWPDCTLPRGVGDDDQLLSHAQLFETPWTIACQAPLSMGGFPRQEYRSGLSFPSPGDLPDPGSNLCLLQWQADSLPLSHLGKPSKGRGVGRKTNLSLIY